MRRCPTCKADDVYLAWKEGACLGLTCGRHIWPFPPNPEQQELIGLRRRDRVARRLALAVRPFRLGLSNEVHAALEAYEALGGLDS